MEASARRTRIGLLIGALAFGAIVLAWTHLTGQAVLRPLQTLEEAFSRLRAGDLSVRLPVVGRDETARMTEAFNLTCEQLASMTSLLKEAAHRVAGEAKGLSASADRVSGTTIQLARTTLTQRQATEQVAAAMLQLGASVEAQEDNLSRVREEGRRATDLAMDCRSLAQESTEVLEAVHRRSEQLMEASATLTELARGLAAALAGHSEPAIRESLANSVRSAEEAVALVIQNLEGMQKGRSRLDAMTFALEETLVGLATMDRLAEEIRLVTRDQVAASREVTQRMAETTRGTGEVQLAAAQLANTVPEVNHTARELAGVAMGLASTADTFTLG